MERRNIGATRSVGYKVANADNGIRVVGVRHLHGKNVVDVRIQRKIPLANGLEDRRGHEGFTDRPDGLGRLVSLGAVSSNLGAAAGAKRKAKKQGSINREPLVLKSI